MAAGDCADLPQQSRDRQGAVCGRRKTAGILAGDDLDYGKPLPYGRGSVMLH